MRVSEHLQRELHYGLNAVLLRYRQPPEPERLATEILRILSVFGPPFHEDDVIGRWVQELNLDSEELEFELADTLGAVLEELEDDEEPWSAHRILELLAEESFWVFEWEAPGEARVMGPSPARGTPVPLVLRSILVRMFNQLEVQLYDAKQDLRSVHDELPAGTIERSVDALITSIHGLAKAQRGPLTGLVRRSDALPSLGEVLTTIQHWKLSVGFDASPDPDDGEWTMRVIERLYDLEWVAARPEEPA